MDYHRFLSDYPRTYIGRGPSELPRIALTFDDGPGDATPALLAALRELAVGATFFCVGEKASRQPGVMREIVDGGHELGNHGYAHVDLRPLDAETFWQAHVRKTATVLDAFASDPVTLFRPPYGEIAPVHVERLAEAGHTLVGWSIDPRDWADPLAPDHVDRVVQAVLDQAHAGAIVLLHDGNDDEDKGRAREAIPAIVRRLVPALRRAGYEFAGVGDLLRQREAIQYSSR